MSGRIRGGGPSHDPRCSRGTTADEGAAALPEPDAAERRKETGTGRPVTVGSTSVAVGVAVGLSAKVVAFGEAPRVTPKPVHAAAAGGLRHRRSLTPGAAKAIVSSPWNARLRRRERVEQLRAELDALAARV